MFCMNCKRGCFELAYRFAWDRVPYILERRALVAFLSYLGEVRWSYELLAGIMRYASVILDALPGAVPEDQSSLVHSDWSVIPRQALESLMRNLESLMRNLQWYQSLRSLHHIRMECMMTRMIQILTY